jgi:superfamily I DNA and RNA helicase
MVVIDSLLTCREHGVVVIDFKQFEGADAVDAVREHQDDLYTALQRKLLQYKPLIKGRELAVRINVMTFVPDEAVARRLAGIEVVGPETLPSLLESYPAIGEDDLRLVNAAIQRIATIKPAVRRSNVVHANSRGGVMQRIEREIANLDQWQKRAAIETPDGPQRVRGLGAPARRSFLP